MFNVRSMKPNATASQRCGVGSSGRRTAGPQDDELDTAGRARRACWELAKPGRAGDKGTGAGALQGMRLLGHVRGNPDTGRSRSLNENAARTRGAAPGALRGRAKAATGGRKVVGGGTAGRLGAESGETWRAWESRPGVRGSIVAKKRGNARGAKGPRKADA